MLDYFNQKESVGYLIDEIRISSTHDSRFLNRNLLPRIKDEASSVKLWKASKINEKQTFKSRVILTVPTRRCLEIVNEHLSDKNNKHKISYIEISRDKFHESESEVMFPRKSGHAVKRL